MFSTVKTFSLVLLLTTVFGSHAFAMDHYLKFTESEYGGFTYICIKDDYMYSVYSEIGAQYGALDGQRVQGKWYEANAISGTFDIEFDSNFSSFNGTYEWDGVTYSLSETLVEEGSNLVQCGFLYEDQEAKIDGRWMDATDFCVNDGNFTGAYNEEYVGYQRGGVYRNNRIASGWWVEEDLQGTQINLVLNSTLMLEYWWVEGTESWKNADNEDDHGTTLSEKGNGNEDIPEDCDRNNNIADNSDSNGSNGLVLNEMVALVFLVIAILLA
eukprot:gb/GECH01012598.1/.p1 GENE.gb/GECH01012598.1/~~gb/GECH01012598.1/.p1  ORF type:complete len:270 (+),score=49.20 gb/GECH01012598.1/:1-810(+)